VTALAINDTAPDFETESTEGRIRFHDWIGNGWAVLFSHPKDFTPVCTTELGYMAKIKPEFDRRNVKIMGLSVDSVSDHTKWSNDIKETQGYAPNYPIIGDGDFKVSKLYEMLPPSTTGDPGRRTPAENQTVRNVFVIGPDKKIKRSRAMTSSSPVRSPTTRPKRYIRRAGRRQSHTFALFRTQKHDCGRHRGRVCRRCLWALIVADRGT